MIVYISLLLLLFIIAYYSCGQDILSPATFSILFFGVSSFVWLINYKTWGIEVNYNAMLLIVMSLFMMTIGNIYINSLLMTKGSKLVCNNQLYYIYISKKLCLFMFAFGMLIVFLTYLEIISIVGNAESYASVMRELRVISAYRLVRRDKLLALGSFYIRGVGYFFMYVFILNKIVKKIAITNNKVIPIYRLMLPLIPLFFIEILSSARIGFIVAIYMYLCLQILLKRSILNKKIDYKDISYMLLWLLTYFIIFIGLGILSGKVELSKAIDTVSIYAGAAIPALNHIFELGEIPSSSNFGINTFNGFYILFDKLNIIDNSNIVLPKGYLYFNNNLFTNLYTAFLFYYIDFGFWGCVLIYFIFGLIFSCFYRFIICKKKIGISLLIYVYFHIRWLSKYLVRIFLHYTLLLCIQ